MWKNFLLILPLFFRFLSIFLKFILFKNNSVRQLKLLMSNGIVGKFVIGHSRQLKPEI